MAPLEARVYDMYDTLVTDNTFDLLEVDNPELASRARKDFASVREQALKAHAEYKKKGLIRPKTMPGAREALERDRKDGYRVVVLSNGPQTNIHGLLAGGGLDGLVDHTFSTDDIAQLTGREARKDDPQVYVVFAKALAECGLVPLSYVDDKEPFCQAALASGVFQQVYHIGSGPTIDGIIRIATVADIPSKPVAARLRS